MHAVWRARAHREGGLDLTPGQWPSLAAVASHAPADLYSLALVPAPENLLVLLCFSTRRLASSHRAWGGGMLPAGAALALPNALSHSEKAARSAVRERATHREAHAG